MKFTHIACIAVLFASFILEGKCSKYPEHLAKIRREVSNEDEIKVTTPAPQPPLPRNVQVNVTREAGDVIPEVIVNVAPTEKTQPDEAQLDKTQPITQEEDKQLRQKKSPFCIQVQSSPYSAPETICDPVPQEQYPGLNAFPSYNLPPPALDPAAFGPAVQPSPVFLPHASAPIVNAPFIQPQLYNAPLEFQQQLSFPNFHPSPPAFNNIDSYQSLYNAPVMQPMSPTFQVQPDTSFGSAFQFPYGIQPSPYLYLPSPHQSSYSLYPVNLVVLCDAATSAASANTQTYGQTAPAITPSHSFALPPHHVPTSSNAPSYGNAPSSHVYSSPSHHVQTPYNAPSYGSAPPSHSYSAPPQHASHAYNAASIGSSHAASGSQYNTQPHSSYGSYQSQHSYTTSSYTSPSYGNSNDISSGPQSVKLMPSYTSAGATETYRDAEIEKKELNQTLDATNSTAFARATRDSHYIAPAVNDQPHKDPPASDNYKYTQPKNAGSNYDHNPSLNLAPSFNPSQHSSSSSTPQNIVKSAPSFNPTPLLNSAPIFNISPPSPFFNPTPQFSSRLPPIFKNPTFPTEPRINNAPLPFNPTPMRLVAPTAPLSTPPISNPLFIQGAIHPYNTETMASNNGGTRCTAYVPPGTQVPLRLMWQPSLDTPYPPMNSQPPTYRDDNAQRVQVGTDKEMNVKGKDKDGIPSIKKELNERMKFEPQVKPSKHEDPGSDPHKLAGKNEKYVGSDHAGPPPSKPYGKGFKPGHFNSQYGRPNLPTLHGFQHGGHHPGQKLGQPGQFFGHQGHIKRSLHQSPGS